ncbi:nucleolar protein 16-like [Amphibalanus amphitrite]|uniref:nucleolar protein 16-like n=1 Tax=Amphibalanus amphitrite TaxID=1232801 RepID=UPI001C90D78B|nr:nucleolar protein 16-like [Amphibalanus amphitrite]
MGKTVKQRKKKQYMYNVNRRKVQQKRKKKLEPRIPCEAIREAWDSRKHTKANLESMGLAFKVNAVLPVPPTSSSDQTSTAGPARRRPVTRPEVVSKLEAEANRPRERKVRLPTAQVRLVEHFLDKFGDDFVRMARSERNHYQLTPKQIRRLVTRFWDIPEHYTPYMKRKGMLEKPTVPEGDED